MRVVVDTNVAVSGLINPSGTPGAVVGAWKRRIYDWVLTPETLAELEDVLRRPKVARYMPKGSTRTERFLQRLSQTAVVVTRSAVLSIIPSDPAGDRFVEAAVAAGADFIVTGDRHLLELREFEGTRIVTPVEFLAELHLLR